MVAINQIALPATVVLGLVSQALALPVQSTQAIVESGLLERAIEAEIEERAIDDVDVSERDELDERSFKSFIKGVGRVAKGAVKMVLRDDEIEELVQRDIEELSERDADELSERDIDDIATELTARYYAGELDERSFKSFIKGVGRVAKGAVKMVLRDETEELSERDFDDAAEELTARYYAGELDERSFKSFIKGVGRVAKGAVKMVLRDMDELEERDLEEIEERDFEEIEERDFEEIEERDFDDAAAELTARYYAGELDERSFKSFIKGVGRVAKGAVKMVLRDDMEELDERDFEEELSERDIDEMANELTARYYAGELDERSFKSFIKGVGRVAKGAVKMVLRDEVEELSERDFDDAAEELTARYYAGELDERSFKSFIKGVGRVAKGAVKMVLRDDMEELSERDLEELDERDFEEELSERDIDEMATELTARYYAGELDERSFKSFIKGVGRVAKGAVKMVLRDDIEEEIFARYLDAGELDLE